MAPKSASKAQLLAKNAELEAANRKLEEEILALRPLLRDSLPAAGHLIVAEGKWWGAGGRPSLGF